MSEPRGLTVQQLIHELTAEYIEPDKRPVVFARYYVDDKLGRHCVITKVTARADRIDIDIEPEEPDPTPDRP